MMRTEKKKSATVCLAVTVLLTCCLVKKTDCYRLKKTEKRNDADTATGIGVQEGTIVFGKAFQRGSSLESYVIDRTRRASSNDSVEHEHAYQADSTDWYTGSAHEKGAAWKKSTTTLQCLRDQMKFKAVGTSAAQFVLDQDNGHLIPLSQIPSNCGYSMQRNSMALVMLVPYNGCNVFQEGGSYVLPMRWQGIPVLLWCPKPAPTTPAPHYTVTQTTLPPPANPQVPQIPGNIKFPPWYAFALPHSYPKYPVVISDPAMPVKNPEMPKFPFYPPFMPPYLPYLPPPHTTTAAPTTTTTTPSTTSVQQIPFVPPHMHPFPLFPHVLPHFHLPFPLPPVSQPTVAPKPQLPQFPPYVPMPQFPFPLFYPKIPHPQFPQNPDMTTATPTTTEVPVDPIVTPPQSHYFPHFHPHGHLHFHPPGPPHQNPPGHPSQMMQFPLPKI